MGGKKPISASVARGTARNISIIPHHSNFQTINHTNNIIGSSLSTNTTTILPLRNIIHNNIDMKNNDTTTTTTTTTTNDNNNLHDHHHQWDSWNSLHDNINIDLNPNPIVSDVHHIDSFNVNVDRLNRIDRTVGAGRHRHIGYIGHTGGGTHHTNGMNIGLHLHAHPQIKPTTGIGISRGTDTPMSEVEQQRVSDIELSLSRLVSEIEEVKEIKQIHSNFNEKATDASDYERLYERVRTLEGRQSKLISKVHNMENKMSLFIAPSTISNNITNMANMSSIQLGNPVNVGGDDVQTTSTKRNKTRGRKKNKQNSSNDNSKNSNNSNSNNSNSNNSNNNSSNNMITNNEDNNGDTTTSISNSSSKGLSNETMATIWSSDNPNPSTTGKEEEGGIVGETDKTIIIKANSNVNGNNNDNNNNGSNSSNNNSNSNSNNKSESSASEEELDTKRTKRGNDNVESKHSNSNGNNHNSSSSVDHHHHHHHHDNSQNNNGRNKKKQSNNNDNNNNNNVNNDNFDSLNNNDGVRQHEHSQQQQYTMSSQMSTHPQALPHAHTHVVAPPAAVDVNISGMNMGTGVEMMHVPIPHTPTQMVPLSPLTVPVELHAEQSHHVHQNIMLQHQVDTLARMLQASNEWTISNMSNYVNSLSYIMEKIDNMSIKINRLEEIVGGRYKSDSFYFDSSGNNNNNNNSSSSSNNSSNRNLAASGSSNTKRIVNGNKLVVAHCADLTTSKPSASFLKSLNLWVLPEVPLKEKDQMKFSYWYKPRSTNQVLHEDRDSIVLHNRLSLMQYLNDLADEVEKSVRFHKN